MLRAMGLPARLVLLVLLALVPVFVLFSWVATDKQGDALRMAESQLQRDALRIASGQQELLDSVRQMVRDIAGLPSIRAGQANFCRNYLRGMHAQQAMLLEIGVMGLNGRPLCNAPSPGLSVHGGLIAPALANEAINRGDLAISGYDTRLPGLVLVMPVFDLDGKLQALAYAVIHINAFGSELGREPVAPGAHVVVVDKKGIILAGSSAARVGSKHADAMARGYVLRPTAGITEVPGVDGSRRVHAFAPVLGSGRGALFVSVSMPRELIFKDAKTDFLFELGFLVLTALFGVTIAWWTGKRLIVNPTRAVLQETNKIASGDLSARVNAGAAYPGEFANLARTFNRMAESPQQREHELKRARTEVEAERSRLDLIINCMTDSLIAVDTRGNFLLFNAAAKKLFPNSKLDGGLVAWRYNHDLLALDGKTLYAPGERPLNRAMRGESVIDWEVLSRRQGGGGAEAAHQRQTPV